jgi:hypothetical protein
LFLPRMRIRFDYCFLVPFFSPFPPLLFFLHLSSVSCVFTPNTHTHTHIHTVCDCFPARFLAFVAVLRVSLSVIA